MGLKVKLIITFAFLGMSIVNCIYWEVVGIGQYQRALNVIIIWIAWVFNFYYSAKADKARFKMGGFKIEKIQQSRNR